MALTFDEEMLFDEPALSDACEDGDSQEHSSIECILLSMSGVDDERNRCASYQQKRRLKNRDCAQQSREADRQYTELLLAEVTEIFKTFEMYVTYAQLLKLHGACAQVPTEHRSDVSDGFDHSRLKRKSNISFVPNECEKIECEKRECEKISWLDAMSGDQAKQRNRMHARTSRYRKNKFMLDILQERDVSLSTLADVSVHTATLELSCAVLNDFNDNGDAFIKLTQMRQGLFHRTRTHKQNHERLKSRLVYRAAYRVHFKQSTH